MSEGRDTDVLVETLARDLRAVRPILPLRAALAAVAAAGALSLFALGGPSWLRPDFGPSLPGAGRFAAVAAGLAVLAAGGLVGALVAREPGRRPGFAWAAAGVGALLGPTALLAAVFLGSGVVPEPPAALGLACLLRGLLVAALPGVVALSLLARGAPAQALAAAALAGVGAVAFGAVCQHVACQADGIRHVLMSHALAPALGILPALAFARWRGRAALAR